MSLDKFMSAYERHFRANVAAHPEQFVNSDKPEKIPAFLIAMRKALESGAYLNDSSTFKATCKELGIKHTYKAIAEFIARAE